MNKFTIAFTNIGDNTLYPLSLHYLHDNTIESNIELLTREITELLDTHNNANSPDLYNISHYKASNIKTFIKNHNNKKFTCDINNLNDGIYFNYTNLQKYYVDFKNCYESLQAFFSKYTDIVYDKKIMDNMYKLKYSVLKNKNSNNIINDIYNVYNIIINSPLKNMIKIHIMTHKNGSFYGIVDGNNTIIDKHNKYIITKIINNYSNVLSSTKKNLTFYEKTISFMYNELFYYCELYIKEVLENELVALNNPINIINDSELCTIPNMETILNKKMSLHLLNLNLGLKHFINSVMHRKYSKPLDDFINNSNNYDFLIFQEMYLKNILCLPSNNFKSLINANNRKNVNPYFDSCYKTLVTCFSKKSNIELDYDFLLNNTDIIDHSQIIKIIEYDMNNCQLYPSDTIIEFFNTLRTNLLNELKIYCDTHNLIPESNMIDSKQLLVKYINDLNIIYSNRDDIPNKLTNITIINDYINYILIRINIDYNLNNNIICIGFPLYLYLKQYIDKINDVSMVQLCEKIINYAVKSKMSYDMDEYYSIYKKKYIDKLSINKIDNVVNYMAQTISSKNNTKSYQINRFIKNNYSILLCNIHALNFCNKSDDSINDLELYKEIKNMLRDIEKYEKNCDIVVICGDLNYSSNLNFLKKTFEGYTICDIDNTINSNKNTQKYMLKDGAHMACLYKLPENSKYNNVITNVSVMEPIIKKIGNHVICNVTFSLNI